MYSLGDFCPVPINRKMFFKKKYTSTPFAVLVSYCVGHEGFMRIVAVCTLLWKYTRSTSDGGNVGLNLQMGYWWRCCEVESVW